MSKQNFTGNELYHYGVKGQAWGNRRYQNEDGSLTEEGRQHYGVGKPGSLMNRIGLGLKQAYGIRDTDTTGQKIMRGFTGGIVSAAEKSKANSEKMGHSTTVGKELVKRFVLGGNQRLNYYNSYRGEGMGRLESLMRSSIDNSMNTITLGKHGYEFNEKKGLEHDAMN